MLAAGAQTQAEAGLVQHDVADDEQCDAQRDKDAQLQAADAEQERLVGVVQLGAAAVAEVLGDDHSHRRRQQIQGRAADAGDSRRQHRDDHGGESRQALGQHGEGEDTRHTADDHDAFQCDVDDAGVLTEHTAQSTRCCSGNKPSYV